MKYSVKLSDAVHILAYIEMYQGTDLSSETIAESIETNPVSVRKLMSSLKKSELINSQNGKAAPLLAKSAADITLYDIYTSVESNPNLFQVDTNTAVNCVVGGNIQAVLTDTYAQLQHTVEEQMRQITLAEIIRDISLREIQKGSTNAAVVQPFL